MLSRTLVSTSILFLIVFSSLGQSVKKKSAPAWVSLTPASLDVNPENKPTGSSYYLFIERQLNLSTQERHNRSILKILSSEGVQEMSDLSVDFDPEYESLTFNSILIHRKGEKIDKLPAAEIKVVQREQSMERYLYDGTKTAYINLTDVRTDDVIEYAYTLKGYNPVFKQHFSQYLYFEYSFPYQKLHQRVIVPKGREIYFHYRNGEVKPTLHETALNKEYTWTLENTQALLVDNNTPYGYDPYRYMAITDFKDWGAVKDWGLQQFVVTPEQENKVKNKLPKDLLSGSLEERLQKSIRFVQDEIRYLGFENGVHSHQPHAPEKVLDQRFGDCKDKSLLLVVIARIQGVEAAPIFVNTSIRNKINEEPPTYYGFDHCVAQLKYSGKTIFIDPTISNQGGSLETLHFPFYAKGLVVDAQTKDLSDLSEPAIYGTTEEQIFELTEIGKSARLTVRTTYVGKDADSQRSEVSSTDLETMQKNYRTFYANTYPDIIVEKPLDIKDDRAENIVVIEEYYSIENFWKPLKDSESKIYCEFYPQSIDRLVSIEKSTQRKAPYRLTYPLSFKHITLIKLPEPWNAQNDDTEVNSEYYTFSSTVNNEGTEITITNHYRTKASEVPVDFINTFVEDHQKILSELNYNLTYDKSAATDDYSSAKSPVTLLVLLLAIAAGAVLVIKLNKFNPASPSDYYRPIGGWLIIPAIGLCLTPLILVYALANPENNFFNQQVWDELQATGQYGLLSLVIFELSFNIVFLFFTGLLILQFFQRRTSFPRLIIFFYAINFGVVLFDSLALYYISGDSLSESAKDIAKSLLAAAIWIPYFIKSERVKETFTIRQ